MLLANEPKIKKWHLLPDARTKFLLVTVLGRQWHGRGNSMSIYFVTACGKHFEVRRMSRGHTKLSHCRQYGTFWLDTIAETTEHFLTAPSMLWYRPIGLLLPVTQIVRFRVRSQNCENILLTSLCVFFRLSAWNNWAPVGRIFMKFNIWMFFRISVEKFKFHENLIRITRTLHEDQYTLLYHISLNSA
jgi:hypothetical protein